MEPQPRKKTAYSTPDSELYDIHDSTPITCNIEDLESCQSCSG